MAPFLASIDSLTGGRAFVDIASGDSAVFIGYTAASRARIADYVACLRGLLASGTATYQGRPQRVRWATRAMRSGAAPATGRAPRPTSHSPPHGARHLR
jgi:alkanesulfonate monooxygenase SsuD/methylene tetrahydromethanopterin reductase-like flavin-dependent oxidoreductase (luciferase family)